MKTYISGLLALIPSCLIGGYAFAVGTAVVLPGQHEAGVDLSGSHYLRMLSLIGKLPTVILSSELMPTKPTMSGPRQLVICTTKSWR